MILLIDNYDSFTFNLYQCLGAIDPHCEIVVRRNDAITLDDIDALNPTHLIVSPGPGTPDTAGISVDAIQHLAGRIPILGVCLGHQCIGRAFGATIGPAGRLMHGKTSQVTHDGRTVFAGLDNPFVATRYHSLAVLDASLPQSLQVSARTDDGEIMALRHRELPIDGVQFHPESFLTRLGPSLMANFLTAQLRPADQLSSAP